MHIKIVKDATEKSIKKLLEEYENRIISFPATSASLTMIRKQAVRVAKVEGFKGRLHLNCALGDDFWRQTHLKT